eukprot:CAMPEP_0113488634 /NCGR_PEP_ID=MMETSP0014_2-20120614/26118_1 /TAXON_ID=2857 /ORGANISM="Nitzschia sp." /LENGTH=670 /DNA_ID=CAMNT_0000382353 /DNA_START=195 /DNA_END=2207 /DNA_ORIENTATION=- /assembly_acc=CAM_ASM_000159
MGFLVNRRKKKNATSGASAADEGQQATKSKQRRFGLGGGSKKDKVKDKDKDKDKGKGKDKNKTGIASISSPSPSSSFNGQQRTPSTIKTSVTIVDSKSRGKNFRECHPVVTGNGGGDDKKKGRNNSTTVVDLDDTIDDQDSIEPRNLLDELNVVAATTTTATSTTTAATAAVNSSDEEVDAAPADVVGGDEEAEIGMELVLPSSMYNIENEVLSFEKEKDEDDDHKQNNGTVVDLDITIDSDDVDSEEDEEDEHPESFDLSVEDYEKYVEHQKLLVEGRRTPTEHLEGEEQTHMLTKVFGGGSGSVEIDRSIVTEEKKEDDTAESGAAAAAAAVTATSVVSRKDTDDEGEQRDAVEDNNLKSSPAPAPVPAHALTVTPRFQPARATATAAAAKVASAGAGLLSCAAVNMSSAAVAATTASSNPCQPLCGPCTDNDDVDGIVNKSIAVDTSDIVENDEYVYFNDNFAMKFLDTVLNVGFTLVYHQAIDNDESWVGRTVTMALRPGVCTATSLQHPYIEWTSMGGGKVQTIETVSIGLFDINTVAVSSLNVGGSGEGDETGVAANCSDEELDCFFTITSRDGEVHLFEALSPTESQIIVNGIRNIVARLSTLLVAGDLAVVTEYYDTSSFFGGNDFIENTSAAANGTKQSVLSTDEIMLRLSHSFLEQSPLA